MDSIPPRTDGLVNFNQELRSRMRNAALLHCPELKKSKLISLHDIPYTKIELSSWAEKVASTCISGLSDREAIFDLLLLIIGIICSDRIGLTPESSHLAQLRLFSHTDGVLQELLSLIGDIKESGAPIDITGTQFNQVSGSASKLVLASLFSKGYAKWPQLLPDYTLDRINDALHEERTWDLKYANNEHARVYGNGIENRLNFVKASTSLSLDTDWLLSIAHDGLLKLVVDSYLNGNSKLRNAQIWVTRPGGSIAAMSEAAQFYHFDLDTHKWLKVFIYLTDVGFNNGPHCAVMGTHLPETKSITLRKRGYQRISDDDIDAYQEQEQVQFLGSAGTIIVGDTKAYHKGLPVLDGERRLLQLLYSCNNFALSFGN